MTIEIIRNGWLRQKWHARIRHANGKILFWSETQNNKKDLEGMIENAKRDFPTAKIVYK